MSLKAGRVGVNPEDVNPINGKIQVEAPDNVYTKTQADNKFETKSHATSTYETKADAEQLQPKTLAVPIEMLSGTKLTVEDALQGFDEVIGDLRHYVFVSNATDQKDFFSKLLLNLKDSMISNKYISVLGYALWQGNNTYQVMALSYSSNAVYVMIVASNKLFTGFIDVNSNISVYSYDGTSYPLNA